MSFHRESREELVAPLESNEGLLCVSEFSCHHDWSWPGPACHRSLPIISPPAAVPRIPAVRRAKGRRQLDSRPSANASATGKTRPIPVFDLSAKPPLGTVRKADKTRPACARLCVPVSCPHHLFSAVDAATFKAVRRSSGVPCNSLRITATSALIPVRSAGSASGANNGEWLEGSDIPFALAWA